MIFDPEKFVSEAVEKLKKDIGEEKAIIAASGGVDSTVAASLASKAIGKKLIAVFVNTGYLRKDEPENTQKLLKAMDLDLRYVDAGKEFCKALKGVEEPEKKRKIIGKKFIKIFEKVAKKEKVKHLLQGTIAPDWIESGGQMRDTIKSHHNVGGLPEKMGLKLIEPLRDLYKDEVRKVAAHLGIGIKEKQPFPGPGLAVRIVGEATKERTDIIREACAIVEEELDKAADKGIIERPWQYFAALIPVKSVGVHGDKRAYGYTITIRAVDSIDGMTANYSKIPHKVLDKISIRITNTLKDKVNRIVYDITNKPPGTIEWE